MGLIKWLFGMNLSEEDLEHNRRIDERERFEREAFRMGFGEYCGDSKGVRKYKEYLKELEEHYKLARNKNEEHRVWMSNQRKLESHGNENNARFKIINMKQKQNIPLTKDELEFINNYNNKNLDSNNNPDSNDQNKSNLELQLAIKQKELELLKLRAQMEKEKN